MSYSKLIGACCMHLPRSRVSALWARLGVHQLGGPREVSAPFGRARGSPPLRVLQVARGDPGSRCGRPAWRASTRFRVATVGPPPPQVQRGLASPFSQNRAACGKSAPGDAICVPARVSAEEEPITSSCDAMKAAGRNRLSGGADLGSTAEPFSGRIWSRFHSLLESFSHSLPSAAPTLTHTPGSFIDFPGRADRDNMVWYKDCAMGN